MACCDRNAMGVPCDCWKGQGQQNYLEGDYLKKYLKGRPQGGKDVWDDNTERYVQAIENAQRAFGLQQDKPAEVLITDEFFTDEEVKEVKEMLEWWRRIRNA